jgi:acyl-coenzyme A synthetase/AMP-(fatty) acid ligase
MNNLTGACRAMDVSIACLTPTVARSLSIADIPNLEKLVVTGEPLTRGDLESWSDKLQLFSIYGITEASLGSSQTAQLDPSSPPNILGTPYSGVFWVVDSDNSDRLAPVGAVGELIIESPSIARSYLHNVEGGLSPFIDSPTWLQSLFPGRSQRVYKSGDLVRYTSENTLEYIARKDTVIKINGQRVDLTDIQDCLKKELSEITDSAVDVVPLYNDTPVLAAFLASKDAKISHCEVLRSPAESRNLTRLGFEVAERLREKLPRHSIPSVFVPVCLDLLELLFTVVRLLFSGVSANHRISIAANAPSCPAIW